MAHFIACFFIFIAISIPKRLYCCYLYNNFSLKNPNLLTTRGNKKYYVTKFVIRRLPYISIKIMLVELA